MVGVVEEDGGGSICTWDGGVCFFILFFHVVCVRLSSCDSVRDACLFELGRMLVGIQIRVPCWATKL